MRYALTPIDLHNDILASSGIRFANYLLDRIVDYLIGTTVLGLLTYFVDMADETYYDQPYTMIIRNFLIGLVFTMAYYFIMETTLGRTIGKFATSTVVVTDEGLKPTTRHIAIRTLCRLIPFDAFSFLGSGVGWHDTISNTRVVKISAYEFQVVQESELEEIGQNIE
ncbi:RDD family protein [Flavobacterium sp.]|uniref:RDD family protein n=1 Tax=Flavobacterium sp. TaxID=239 RepID=UPI001208DD13|nr:RDD family protein [Flavobacterium sp.]RZJ73917.1 MAG: RDD family protein [Flavobacterium sp.]